jgi:hypothetical protein
VVSNTQADLCCRHWKRRLVVLAGKGAESHLLRNPDLVPRAAQSLEASVVSTIFAHPDAAQP